ncbi:carbohydrate ABC transporter permease [Paenibacillus thalictri]|uniref:Carbohydrate ABC transporter permease n=1 Tax=Paenibacillus thalictri TaxID=2527873 RepID=A0A4Q9DLH9_9BACL|nr:carbohydrate ABC transporter permease [Paenibacillus thalictri]TBL76045.1 carbohydrate ABC transporter permease [Paenibacillus thalictri]
MNAKAGDRTVDIIINIVIFAALALCLIPFLHILSISLSSNRAIMSGEVTIYPIELSMQAFKKVLEDVSMIRSMGFTVALTMLYTVSCMFMSVIAAYPLTKPNLRGRKFFMLLIVVTMFFSGGIIPEYILIKQLHLMNTMWALILPLLISPFNLIILINFFKSIPDSLHESAEIDGASHFRVLWQIVVPLSLPVIATLSLFYAVNRWNGFMDTLFYITNPNLYPLQLKLYQLVMNNMANDLMQLEGNQVVQFLPESLKAASVMFATIPILLVYPWLQRYFVSGIMLGAVKG